MKKYILIALLIFQASVPATPEDRDLAAPKERDYVVLDSFVIKFIDGTNLINIAEIIHYAKNLFRLTKGTTPAEATALFKEYNLPIHGRFEDYADKHGRVGLIWFKGNYWSIKDLRAYEMKNPNDPDLPAALIEAQSCFERLSESYVAHIETGKHIMIKLIDQWSHLRSRPNSLLCNWSKIDHTESESIRKNMTTFEIFDTFLADLLLFLKDFMHNCPKSLHAYKEQLKQQTHESAGKN
jgi:hypothetical protein